MDVREKLVEILKQAPFEGKVLDEWWWEEKIRIIADHLISNGVTVQEWVSTDERMPTQEDAPTEYVFTAYKNQNCYDVGIALLDTVVVYPDLYDYWMALPMPEPPKGDVHNE